MTITVKRSQVYLLIYLLNKALTSDDNKHQACPGGVGELGKVKLLPWEIHKYLILGRLHASSVLVFNILSSVHTTGVYGPV